MTDVSGLVVHFFTPNFFRSPSLYLTFIWNVFLFKSAYEFSESYKMFKMAGEYDFTVPPKVIPMSLIQKTQPRKKNH